MTSEADEKEAEVLRSLLSVSRVQNAQITDLGGLSYWQPNEGVFTTPNTQEHMIWHVDPNGDIAEHPNVVHHHIPVAYVTTDSRFNNQTTDKQFTYVLSYDPPKAESLEPEKIMLIQELDNNLDEGEQAYAEVGLGGKTVYEVNVDNIYEPKGSCIKGEVIDVDIEANVNDETSERVSRLNATYSESLIQAKQIKNKPGRKKKGLKKTKKALRINKKNEIDETSLSSIDDKPPPVAKRKLMNKKKCKLLKRKNQKIKITAMTYPSQAAKMKMGNMMKSDETSENEERIDECSSKFKANHNVLTKLEDNAEQVLDRFHVGCECLGNNCFDGLSAEKVFRHRLNIADLTKAEHDMYLMGVIMASMQNPDETCRHKERIRIRSSYVYQGKKVCLTAFLYLEHVTLYQMKRLRKHLRNHGVSPRIHGNYGRKPANTLSLDIYQHATSFVQSFIERKSVKSVPIFTTFEKFPNAMPKTVSSEVGQEKSKKKFKIANRMTSYHLPSDCKKKTVHKEYQLFCESSHPQLKGMQYSTFTSFLKKQFPNVKFQKPDKKTEEKIFEPKVVVQLVGDDGDDQKQKAKGKKKVVKVDRGEMVTSATDIQEGNCVAASTTYTSSKNIQTTPSSLIVAQKPNPQTVYSKSQMTSAPVMKASQVILNAQPVQFCSANTQIQTGISRQLLMGNQILTTHCVSSQPGPGSFAQHVYTIPSVMHQ